MSSSDSPSGQPLDATAPVGPEPKKMYLLACSGRCTERFDSFAAAKSRLQNLLSGVSDPSGQFFACITVECVVDAEPEMTENESFVSDVPTEAQAPLAPPSATLAPPSTTGAPPSTAGIPVIPAGFFLHSSGAIVRDLRHHVVTRQTSGGGMLYCAKKNGGCGHSINTRLRMEHGY